VGDIEAYSRPLRVRSAVLKKRKALLFHAKAMTFDVGGTLDGPGIPWRPRFLAHYRAAGLDVPEDALSRAFYDADDHLHERHSLAGLDLAGTVGLQVADTLANLGRQDANLARRVTEAFVSEARACFRAARPVLERLARTIPLGIVSNSYGNLRDVLQREGLLDLFRTVIDSREVGFEKPDPRIFHAAAHALGVDPRAMRHVGDSVERDVKGALHAGVPPIWYAPDAPYDAEAEPHRIRSLSELLRVGSP
jgi:HAD superfamily hydrolase (TIGR01549 family)